jgi:hypothetical protein
MPSVTERSILHRDTKIHKQEKLRRLGMPQSGVFRMKRSPGAAVADRRALGLGPEAESAMSEHLISIGEPRWLRLISGISFVG